MYDEPVIAINEDVLRVKIMHKTDKVQDTLMSVFMV
jgi:hypothetical protein